MIDIRKVERLEAAAEINPNLRATAKAQLLVDSGEKSPVIRRLAKHGC
jgi:hypothetical protein